MERELWRLIVPRIRRLPTRRPRGAVYTDKQIIAVALWAALHTRPISWACNKQNWPPAAWRRVLPDQSTMSRRLRDPVILEQIDRIRREIERPGPPGRRLLADGMPLVLAEHTRDPDAANGYACRGYGRGYKLHLIIDDRNRVVGWSVRPMNDAECKVVRELMEKLAEGERLPPTMVADAAYDSVRLYRACAAAGVRLIARRRKPGRGIKVHHPDRDRAIRLLERGREWAMRAYAKTRQPVEHFFARLKGAGTGMWGLPPWVRGQRRVTLWVSMKLVINAARIRLTDRPQQVLDA